MPEPDSDPIASTQMFRAFVQGGEAESATPSRLRSRVVTISVILALAVVAAVVVWLLVR